MQPIHTHLRLLQQLLISAKKNLRIVCDQTDTGHFHTEMPSFLKLSDSVRLKHHLPSGPFPDTLWHVSMAHCVDVLGVRCCSLLVIFLICPTRLWVFKDINCLIFPGPSTISYKFIEVTYVIYLTNTLSLINIRLVMTANTYYARHLCQTLLYITLNM